MKEIRDRWEELPYNARYPPKISSWILSCLQQLLKVPKCYFCTTMYVMDSSFGRGKSNYGRFNHSWKSEYMTPCIWDNSRTSKDWICNGNCGGIRGHGLSSSLQSCECLEICYHIYLYINDIVVSSRSFSRNFIVTAIKSMVLRSQKAISHQFCVVTF